MQANIRTYLSQALVLKENLFIDYFNLFVDYFNPHRR
jgi:hypothetical protein